MKRLGCILSLFVLMGLECQAEQTPVTFRVQYVNNSGLNVRFRAVDATNTNIGEYSMQARDPTNQADPPISLNGVPPIVFTMPFIDQAQFASVPSAFGIGPVQSSAVSGKLFVVEATANQTIQSYEVE